MVLLDAGHQMVMPPTLEARPMSFDAQNSKMSRFNEE